MRRPNNRQSKICLHQWKTHSVITIKNKNGGEVPRLVQICKKCGQAIHLPVYTLSQLAQEEIYGGQVR